MSGPNVEATEPSYFQLYINGEYIGQTSDWEYVRGWVTAASSQKRHATDLDGCEYHPTPAAEIR